MRKLLIAGAILFSCAANSFAAGNYSEQWQKGNHFYDQKQYDSAAFYFEQIASLQPANDIVYYNLGNTYYRLNKIAPAILNYERALKINPDNTAASDNLVLAKARIVSPLPGTGEMFFAHWWQAVTRPDRSNALAAAALLLFLLIISMQIANRLKKTSDKRPPRLLTGALAFVFVCVLVPALIAAKNANGHTSAVVMIADTPLMNDEMNGKPLALIPEGTTVKIEDEKGEWIEVKLPDGRTGWLQKGTIDKI